MTNFEQTVLLLPLKCFHRDASVGAIWCADCTKKATWHRQNRVSGFLLNSCNSLLEKVGSFIKPLNPAECFKSSRHQPLPPQRWPEVLLERSGIEIPQSF